MLAQAAELWRIGFAWGVVGMNLKYCCEVGSAFGEAGGVRSRPLATGTTSETPIKRVQQIRGLGKRSVTEPRLCASQRLRSDGGPPIRAAAILCAYWRLIAQNSRA